MLEFSNKAPAANFNALSFASLLAPPSFDPMLSRRASSVHKISYTFQGQNCQLLHRVLEDDCSSILFISETCCHPRESRNAIRAQSHENFNIFTPLTQRPKDSTSYASKFAKVRHHWTTTVRNAYRNYDSYTVYI